jgi:hypothetical protein
MQGPVGANSGSVEAERRLGHQRRGQLGDGDRDANRRRDVALPEVGISELRSIAPAQDQPDGIKQGRLGRAAATDDADDP